MCTYHTGLSLVPDTSTGPAMTSLLPIAYRIWPSPQMHSTLRMSHASPELVKMQGESLPWALVWR